jgi:hypothetical protein
MACILPPNQKNIKPGAFILKKLGGQIAEGSKASPGCRDPEGCLQE